ncbi:MAG: UDP-N-acetylmuramoyl-tripeptide--D-alanyl-D-alanine ligase [Gammaproteobacteria bacterium]|nr:UDP-N-acetylmuramoyl-tripeptide--D-alanyl-D-alanine ligase [Gammaproteobacteria bacterium]MCY4228221.1 UDP-N-acetylmuramoyl-tripeptide--D-alanyl-D-alanine ligase [Gammaproteobacteria bacterium]
MMSLSEAAAVVGGELHGNGGSFNSVSIDSRTLSSGGLFVAIPGKAHDGHDFVERSAESGAAGAMVANLQSLPIPQIKVADTTQSLGMLARNWRERFNIPVLAITGSNGKTTVTRMTASILAEIGACLSPEKSFNNQWGVPLTLLGLNHSHQFAVIEMGTNGPGEIDYLSRLTRPTIALINNVSAAHVEGLGDVRKISEAKSEIFSGMGKRGTAIINLDDPFHDEWQSHFKNCVPDGEILTFGSAKEAMIRSESPNPDWQQSEFDLVIDRQAVHVVLPLPGIHNIHNATASAALAYAAGADTESIRKGLENTSGAPGRLRRARGIRGCELLDDSYNANPRSTMAAIDVLAGYPGKKILVLGEMAELGQAGPEYHREVGAYARQKHLDRFYCLGQQTSELSASYVEGFGNGAVHASDADILIDELICRIDADTAVLVKGSRSSGMENIVAGIAGHAEASEDASC